MTEEVKHGRSSPKPMRRPTCLCGAVGIRNDKYDSYYCPESGEWLESRCPDDGPFPGRPEKAF